MIVDFVVAVVVGTDTDVWELVVVVGWLMDCRERVFAFCNTQPVTSQQ